MTEPPLTRSTVLVRNDEPVAVEVDRTVVMMSLAQGMYYGLEGPGPRIWELLAEPRTIESLCQALTTEFEVDAETCFNDVIAFVTEMRSADLVRVHE
ncbi:MAG: PqqD family peptide modification chaperone [Gemmatimonadales bacterium]